MIRGLFYYCLKKQTQYRLNFILLCIVVIPVHLIQMIFSIIIVEKFGFLAEWSKWDLVFLYGIFMTSYSVAQIFFRQFRYLENYIINGQLDCYYIRPQSIMFSLIFYNLNILEIFSQFLPSLIVLLIACANVSIVWNIKKILVLIYSLLVGTAIISTIFIWIGCASFWLMSSSQLEEIFFAFKDFMNYPITIYGKMVAFFLSYVLPLAFVNYYPATYLLGKNNEDINVIFLEAFISILLFIMTKKLWKISIKHYESSGN